jgi:hypothetical protein
MKVYRCLRGRGPEESAATALVSVAQHHGVPLRYRSLSVLTGVDSAKMDLLYLLFAARKLGFEALPLEGVLTPPRGAPPLHHDFRKG